MNRKTLLSLSLIVLVASFVSACGSSSKKTTPVSVQFAPAPPASLEVNLSVQLAAQTVSDTTNAGVDWTVACTTTAAAGCGTISPAHTASGGSTTYTAPTVVPTGGSGAVTITAASTAQSSATAAAMVTINPLGSSAGLVAMGQYAFSVTGVDANGFYSAVGSFTSNGDGTLAGGEEDFNDVVAVSLGDTLTNGTYNIGPDGRGTISFTANTSSGPDTFINGTGSQTFTVVATSNFVTAGTHLLIVEADLGETSSGVVDLQSSGDFAGGVAPASYVFTLAGEDLTTGFPTTFGGAAAADGMGNITGALDENDDGSQTTGTTLTGSTYTALDLNGRGTVTFATGQTFTIYLVTAECLRILETDNSFITSGTVYGASPGTSFAAAALTGSFVFIDNGQSALGPVALGGQITTDGNVNITAGVDDDNEGGAVLSAAAVTGTYAVPDPTMPRVVFTITGGNSGAITNVIAYLTDPALNLLDPNNTTPASGALLMDSDISANGIGLIIPQAPPSSSVFAGNYGLNIQVNAQFADEEDASGQGLSDGVSMFNGTGDFAELGATDSGDVFTGTFAADTSNPGRLTATDTFTTAGVFDFAIYEINGAQAISIGSDTTDVAIGTLISQ